MCIDVTMVGQISISSDMPGSALYIGIWVFSLKTMITPHWYLGLYCNTCCIVLYQEFVIQLKNKLKTPRQHHHLSDREDDDDDDDDDDYMTRDNFNLHKMIVGVTGAGKVRTVR